MLVPSLPEIFPALASGGTALGQAGSQVLAIIITLGMAVTGGLITGQLGFYLTEAFVSARVDRYVDDLFKIITTKMVISGRV